MIRSLPAVLIVVSWLASCGGPQPAPYVEPDTEGVCKVDPAVSPGRVAKPTTQADCFDPAAFGVVQDACNTSRDPVACFEAGQCLNLAQSRMEPSDPTRGATIASAIEAFGVACDAGIAEGCAIYASMAEEEVLANRDHPDRDALLATMCDGYQKACHLGEEFDGCVRCVSTSCTGLPDAKPAPIRER
jgi:hypothetical protein